MPNTLKMLGEKATPGENAGDAGATEAAVVSLDAARSAPDESGAHPRGSETGSSTPRAAVDKDDRPAGRRFQLFTPPSLERDDDPEPSFEPAAELTPTPPATRAARAIASRRSLIVALALATSAGLAVAAFMVLAFGRSDSSTTSVAPSSLASTSQFPPHPTIAAMSVASANAVASTPPAPASSGIAPPIPPRSAAPAATPPAPTRQPTPGTTTVGPGPAPIAPVEPPF